jgi:hypothetical protein
MVAAGLAAQQNAVPPSAPPSTVPVAGQVTASPTYGLQTGTVGGFVDGGGLHASGGGGLYPALKTGMDIGITKYIGVFAEGGASRISESTVVCPYRCAVISYRANLYEAGGGVEVVGTNHSHFVPYAKVGMAYTWVGGGSGDPAILAAGGLRSYITHHVGIDAQFTVVHVLSRYGDGTYIAPTVGVFFQSK